MQYDLDQLRRVVFPPNKVCPKNLFYRLYHTEFEVNWMTKLDHSDR
jgi:hypothetical protein